MHLIIYISDYTGLEKDIDHDLKAIRKESKKNNPQYDITGVLFYQNGNFLQALEGEKEALKKIMSHIERDDKHTDITRIVDMEINQRSFTDWNMDTFNLDPYIKLKRDDLAKYRDVFSRRCKIDASIFIEVLRILYKDAEMLKMVKR